jgi:hypothetical protein
MNSRYFLPICAAVALLAACAKHDKDAGMSSAPAGDSATAATPDTATTPGGTAGDSATGPGTTPPEDSSATSAPPPSSGG